MPTPPPPPGQFFFPDSPYGITLGLNGSTAANTTINPQAITDILKLGSSAPNPWLRFQIDYALIEPTRGNQNWNALDDAVARCNNAGINLVFPIRAAPGCTQQNGFASNSGPNTPGGYGYGVSTATQCVGTGTQFSDSPWYGCPPPPAAPGLGCIDTTQPCGVLLTSGPNAGQYNICTAVQAGVSATLDDAFWMWSPAGMTYAAGQVAGRYDGNHGHGFLQAIEITNEDSTIHNTSNDKCQPCRDPKWMAAYLPGAYDTIKTISPSTLVGMGAIWWRQLPYAGAYMAGLYANGCKGKFDYANFHFYNGANSPLTDQPGFSHLCTQYSNPNTLPSFPNEWQAIYNVMLANGDGNKGIWATEFGWLVNSGNANQPSPCLGTGGAPAPNTCDCYALQQLYYQQLYDSARTSGGIMKKAFFFTLGYFGNGGSSLAQGSLTPVAGKSVPLYYLPTFDNTVGPSVPPTNPSTGLGGGGPCGTGGFGMKQYIAQYPTWTTPTPLPSKNVLGTGLLGQPRYGDEQQTNARNLARSVALSYTITPSGYAKAVPVGYRVQSSTAQSASVYYLITPLTQYSINHDASIIAPDQQTITPRTVAGRTLIASPILQGYKTMTWSYKVLMRAEYQHLLSFYNPLNPTVLISYPDETGTWVQRNARMLPPTFGTQSTVVVNSVVLSFTGLF